MNVYAFAMYVAETCQLNVHGRVCFFPLPEGGGLMSETTDGLGSSYWQHDEILAVAKNSPDPEQTLAFQEAKISLDDPSGIVLPFQA